MKKKKGFTLIELLAIIVILAIIAVITVPIILNIIDNSRKGAAQDSAYGYKDAINKFYVSKLSRDSAYKIPNGTYIVIYHKGPYNQTFKSYPVILDYAKRHHYELDSMVYEESLIDETVESNPNNYITQIAIRIIGSSDQ